MPKHITILETRESHRKQVDHVKRRIADLELWLSTRHVDHPCWEQNRHDLDLARLRLAKLTEVVSPTLRCSSDEYVVRINNL